MSALIALVYAGLVVAVLVAAGLSLFVRRHGESDVPAEGWERTDEVFVDPTTERRMRVWLDPVDGSRRYVPEG